MICPFELDFEDRIYLADVLTGNCKISFIERAASPRWMLVHSKLDIDQAVEFANSKQELQDILDVKLEAYKAYLQISEEFGDVGRCSRFISDVKALAADLGIDIANIPGIEFLKDWQARFDSSAAGWIIHSNEDLELCIHKVRDFSRAKISKPNNLRQHDLCD